MLKNIFDRLKALSTSQYFLYLGLIVVTFFIFLFRLGTLTNGLSPAEISATTSSHSLNSIINSPQYGPHQILQFFFSHFISHNAFYLRLPSVIFGIFFIWIFYYLAKSWFGKTIAIYSSLIALSTPLIILSARSATPVILLLSPLALLATYTYLEKNKSNLEYRLVLLAITTALLMYIPGMIILVVLGFMFKRKKLVPQIRSVNMKYKSLSLLVFLLLITPLIFGLSHHLNLIRPWLLIPDNWPHVFVVLKQFGWAFLALFYKTPTHIDLNIAKLPILDVTQIILLVFGSYAMARLARTKIYPLIFLVLFGLIGATINNNIFYLMIGLPGLLVFMSAGLRLLFVEWKSVFPKNPIPKFLALSLISLIVGLHILYGLAYSLSAWPKTEATKSTYMIK